jgi:hypothetical protein
MEEGEREVGGRGGGGKVERGREVGKGRRRGERRKGREGDAEV